MGCPTANADGSDPGRTVRLPEIKSVFIDPEHGALPGQTITINEIGECMGRDGAISDAAATLHAESSTLEQEGLTLRTSWEEIEARRLTIETRLQALNKAQQELEGASRRLTLRNRKIDQRRAAKLSPEEGKQLSAEIDSYNREVDLRKTQSGRLSDEFSGLQRDIDAHDAAVSGWNEKQARYNERAAAFGLRVDQFNQSTAGYVADCAGTRRIE